MAKFKIKTENYPKSLKVLLLLLRWLYSPMRTFISLMDFSQSSLQSIWLFRGHILDFLTVDLFWGEVEPHAQPPTWRTRSPYSYPLETGWPNYTPRHRILILVAFYDTHGLQWDFSLPRSPHGGKGYAKCAIIKLRSAVTPLQQRGP
jgi:hypothetical protein